MKRRSIFSLILSALGFKAAQASTGGHQNPGPEDWIEMEMHLPTSDPKIQEWTDLKIRAKDYARWAKFFNRLPLFSAESSAAPQAGSEIERLEEDYRKAANALIKYRNAHGFMPGARVRAQLLDDPPMFGVIAPYGYAWQDLGHYHVPVLLDNGCRQPWSMSRLTVMGAARFNQNNDQPEGAQEWIHGVDIDKYFQNRN